MTPVELIAAVVSTATVAVGGPATFKLVVERFFKKSERGIDASVEIEKERQITARHALDLDVQLKGTTEQQVLILQAWTRDQLSRLSALNEERASTIGRQEAEIKHLTALVEKLSQEREAFRRERDDLEQRCNAVLDAGKALQARLEAKDGEVMRLTRALAKAQDSIAARDATITQMTQRLDDEIAGRAALSAENERLRARDRTERAG